MYADDGTAYVSADNIKLLKHKLETCMNSITNGIQINATQSNSNLSLSNYTIQG